MVDPDAVAAHDVAPVARPPVVVMGVSGSGKSTIGLALANRLGATFVDGDDLHSPANKAKMAGGHPLDDNDRMPWLDAVGDALAARAPDGTAPIVACSALKRAYRDRLRAKAPDTFFVQLDGGRDLLASRLGGRRHEFMPATLLATQLDTLEPLGEDESGVVVSIAPPPAEITTDVIAALGARR